MTLTHLEVLRRSMAAMAVVRFPIRYWLLMASAGHLTPADAACAAPLHWHSQTFPASDVKKHQKSQTQKDRKRGKKKNNTKEHKSHCSMRTFFQVSRQDKPNFRSGAKKSEGQKARRIFILWCNLKGTRSNLILVQELVVNPLVYQKDRERLGFEGYVITWTTSTTRMGSRRHSGYQ